MGLEVAEAPPVPIGLDPEAPRVFQTQPEHTADRREMEPPVSLDAEVPDPLPARPRVPASLSETIRLLGLDSEAPEPAPMRSRPAAQEEQEPAEPAISIHIGRIELRDPAPALPPPSPLRPALSLDEYFARRRRRAR
jgi:hypothetical protein